MLAPAHHCLSLHQIGSGIGTALPGLLQLLHDAALKMTEHCSLAGAPDPHTSSATSTAAHMLRAKLRLQPNQLKTVWAASCHADCKPRFAASGLWLTASACLPATLLQSMLHCSLCCPLACLQRAWQVGKPCAVLQAGPVAPPHWRQGWWVCFTGSRTAGCAAGSPQICRQECVR